mmetsp:Transcript_93259/g.263295  ORF Transcript_93259/g.263295 Transcript_93259/m.263295 type:complete len:422 (-) Transcript_93259:1370-2635(-)
MARKVSARPPAEASTLAASSASRSLSFRVSSASCTLDIASFVSATSGPRAFASSTRVCFSALSLCSSDCQISPARGSRLRNTWYAWASLPQRPSSSSVNAVVACSQLSETPGDAVGGAAGLATREEIAGPSKSAVAEAPADVRPALPSPPAHVRCVEELCAGVAVEADAAKRSGGGGCNIVLPRASVTSAVPPPRGAEELYATVGAADEAERSGNAGDLVSPRLERSTTSSRLKLTEPMELRERSTTSSWQKVTVPMELRERSTTSSRLKVAVLAVLRKLLVRGSDDAARFGFGFGFGLCRGFAAAGTCPEDVRAASAERSRLITPWAATSSVCNFASLDGLPEAFRVGRGGGCAARAARSIRHSAWHSSSLAWASPSLSARAAPGSCPRPPHPPHTLQVSVPPPPPVTSCSAAVSHDGSR